jgi:hypothetical protein
MSSWFFISLILQPFFTPTRKRVGFYKDNPSNIFPFVTPFPYLFRRQDSKQIATAIPLKQKSLRASVPEGLARNFGSPAVMALQL